MTRSLHIARKRPAHPTPGPSDTAGSTFGRACRDVIQEAHDTGAEVRVYLKSVWDTFFLGQVLSVDTTYFELFHSGTEMGMRWTLPFDDVAACALVTYLGGTMPTVASVQPPQDPPTVSPS